MRMESPVLALSFLLGILLHLSSPSHVAANEYFLQNNGTPPSYFIFRDYSQSAKLRELVGMRSGIQNQNGPQLRQKANRIVTRSFVTMDPKCQYETQYADVRFFFFDHVMSLKAQCRYDASSARLNFVRVFPVSEMDYSMTPLFRNENGKAYFAVNGYEKGNGGYIRVRELAEEISPSAGSNGGRVRKSFAREFTIVTGMSGFSGGMDIYGQFLYVTNSFENRTNDLYRIPLSKVQERIDGHLKKGAVAPERAVLQSAPKTSFQESGFAKLIASAFPGLSLRLLVLSETRFLFFNEGMHSYVLDLESDGVSVSGAEVPSYETKVVIFALGCKPIARSSDKAVFQECVGEKGERVVSEFTLF